MNRMSLMASDTAQFTSGLRSKQSGLGHCEDCDKVTAFVTFGGAEPYKCSECGWSLAEPGDDR